MAPESIRGPSRHFPGCRLSQQERHRAEFMSTRPSLEEVSAGFQHLMFRPAQRWRVGPYPRTLLRGRPLQSDRFESGLSKSLANCSSLADAIASGQSSAFPSALSRHSTQSNPVRIQPYPCSISRNRLPISLFSNQGMIIGSSRLPAPVIPRHLPKLVAGLRKSEAKAAKR